MRVARTGASRQLATLPTTINLNSRASLGDAMAMRCDAMRWGVRRCGARCGGELRARPNTENRLPRASCRVRCGVGITETVESCPYKNIRDDVALFIIFPHDTISDKVTARLNYFVFFDNILSNIVTTSSITTLTFSSFKIIYTYP